MKLPNCIIGGTGRAGTTSLFRYLSDHRDVCPASVKETQFFIQYVEDPEQNLPVYESYFSHCSDEVPIRMEATPHYLQWAEKVAPYMSKIIPDVKLIFILRNPVDRMKTLYKVRANEGKESSFQNFVQNRLSLYHKRLAEGNVPPPDTIQSGFYATFLRQYLRYFENNQLLVLFFDDFQRHPRDSVKKICDFLGLDESFYSDYDFSIENKSRNVRLKRVHSWTKTLVAQNEKVLNCFPRLRKTLRDIYLSLNESPSQDVVFDDATINRLTDFYAEANQNLCELLGEQGYCVADLPGWLKSENMQPTLENS